MVYWSRFLEALRSSPPEAHKLRPPCHLARIKEVEIQLGTIPSDLAEMLQYFNGGELFVKTMPLFTLFGLSEPTDPPDFDWFIDRYTPALRSRHMLRSTDWVIGIFNHGVVAILGEEMSVREWDSGQQEWNPDQLPYADWLEKVLAEGALYLLET
jgi:hypothetical protein